MSERDLTPAEALRERMSPKQSYNPHRSCPKCGHGIVTSRHVTFSYLGLRDAIRRRCDRCDYVWDEKPMDAE